MKIPDLRTLPVAAQSYLSDAKEGIVDALLNLTWERSSGAGKEGENVYGHKPSIKFVSGFLLPRFNELQTEDETSDIHISSHGMDFQISSDAQGKIVISPRFSVYVRVLPSWDDLECAKFNIRPCPQLKKQIEALIRDETRRAVKDLKAADASKAANERRNLQAEKQRIFRSLLAGFDVLLQSDEVLAESSDVVISSQSDVAPDNDVASLAPSKGEYIFNSDQAAQPLDVPQKWKRITVEVEPCILALDEPDRLVSLAAEWSEKLFGAISEAVACWIKSDDGVQWAYRPAEILPSNFKSKASWEAFLGGLRSTAPALSDILPSLTNLALMVEASPDLRDPQRQNIRVIFENNSCEVSKHQRDRFEHAIHQVSLTVQIPTSTHRALKLDRVEPSYRFRDFLSYPAIGINCGVSASPGEQFLRLETTWMPRYVQPRSTPTNIPGLSTGFSQLSDAQFDPRSLRALVKEYRIWIDTQKLTLNPAQGVTDLGTADREILRFNKDLEAYEKEVQRIELGISLLEASWHEYNADRNSRESFPFRAWLLLNKTFEVAGQAKNVSSWRLFQLTFILAHIPTLVSRMEEFANAQWYDEVFDEETATLLYFPTGGGKSEAFFGLLVYGLFLDRLRGKLIGVTALLRYPLRLLTLQQGQRLLSILIHAELLRRAEGINGSTFEIGFWVGSGNTPNVPDDDRLAALPVVTLGNYGNDDHTKDEYDTANKSFNKIPYCPACGWLTGLRKVKYSSAIEVAIVCFNSECPWNLGTSFEPLPFLIIDRDIYRHAPSIILGVIDKLALIGQSPSTISRVMGMFGSAHWIECGTDRLKMPTVKELKEGAAAHNCEEISPAFSNGREVFVDPFPSLIIQDEAHLLDESLGTFAGLFETLLEQLFSKSSEILLERVARRPFGERKPRLPKVIAATATVSVPEQQFGSLYLREHVQFPYPGTSIYKSFYSTPAEPEQPGRRGLGGTVPLAPEIESPWMRVYLSLMTNGRTHTVTTVSVLSAYHLAISELWTGLIDDAARQTTVNTILSSISSGPISGFHRTAISYFAANYPAVLTALVDLMRISLTYVTNKKGGDQVIDSFREEVIKVHRSHGLDQVKNIKTRLISGGVDVAEIQEIMQEAQGQEHSGNEFPSLEDVLRSIVATSAISHGVDVDKFNAMFFAGMPNDIAEFIQASSRVGRMHSGFCLLIPTPQARRDRYIVETHDIFHRFLERMIAPPAISRWALTAHDRVFASVFQAWLCGWVQEYLFVKAKSEDKPRSLTFERVCDVQALLASRDFPSAARDFMEFAVAAIGVHGRGYRHIGRAPRTDFYEGKTRDQAKLMIEQFRNLNTTTALRDYWKNPGLGKPPMMSLRDIDEAGFFTLTREFRTKRLAPEDEKNTLQAALRIVRNQHGQVSEFDEEKD